MAVDKKQILFVSQKRERTKSLKALHCWAIYQTLLTMNIRQIK